MTIHVEPSLTASSRSSRIQTVRSATGIEAWLLEEHTLPLLSVAFAFRGGASLDPDGKEGAARVMGGVLTDGAGALDNRMFQEALGDKAIHLSFSCQRDRLSGGLTTLAQHVPRAFELLGLALTQPRMATADIDLKCSAFAAELRMAQSQPDWVASDVFLRRAYQGHPYGRPAGGTIAGLDAVGRDEVEALHRAMITRDNLRIAVVGAIGAEALAAALDVAFGGLPSGSLDPIAAIAVQGLGEQIVTKMDVPQSSIMFGRPALPLKDVDHPAFVVANHCFGSGGFTSRLFSEVREKLGLCYAIGTGYDAAQGLASLLGTTSTRNENVGTVIDLIRSQIARLTQQGIGEKELEAAKSYLIGADVLRFDTSGAIAQILLWMQTDERPKSWLEDRKQVIANVSPADAARAIERVFGDGELLVAIAGNP